MSRFAPHPKRRPAVVTGASSGIGHATALALAEAGFPVMLGARRLDRLEELAAGIRAAGGEAHALRLDLADPESVDSFAKAAVESSGGVEVVVSAAGRNLPDSVHQPSAEDFASIVEVNLLGVQRLVSLLMAPMLARRRGDVVFVTSEVVRLPRVRNSAYVASKWALQGYARTLQMELEGTGVRASIIQPGQTRSEMGWDWDPKATTEILEEWMRWGAARHDHFLGPESVAGAVLSVVQAPPGTHLSLVEVEPEAPPLAPQAAPNAPPSQERSS